MTLLNMQKADIGLEWVRVCSRQDLVAHSGVVALWQGVQIALFHVPGQGEDKVYAVQNRDPRSGANVIGRGLIGTLAGRLVVTAPLYKQHFDLEQGICVEAPEQRLQVWAARLNGDDVEVRAR
ncbi:nitrite reductase small subunit NirD [Pseudomonas sp. S75]|uniref:nitrite reductase small subunit NirD n=1 Tax=unclassified Pseudomonas TaxID=196821 RepID=UPI00190681B3|nr:MULTISPECIES: nitrite reductase small subunit NirD [unclassified Pseudomonas]MBJ9974040.1 nitrite reductase small subunit NirD [Pseudomonas sp. S30]MBK0152030.1 nitrite reductase small subunit NirD [Pseudomonas sp. S75]